MEPKRTVIDYAALQAAVDRHKAEQSAAAEERLKSIRDRASKEQEHIFNLARQVAEKDRAAKRAAAEREAELAAENARQAVIGRYEQETQQTAADRAWRTFSTQLFGKKS